VNFSAANLLRGAMHLFIRGMYMVLEYITRSLDQISCPKCTHPPPFTISCIAGSIANTFRKRSFHRRMCVRVSVFGFRYPLSSTPYPIYPSSFKQEICFAILLLYTHISYRERERRTCQAPLFSPIYGHDHYDRGNNYYWPIYLYLSILRLWEP